MNPPSFSKKENIKAAQSLFSQYCIGYSGQQSYFIGLVMSIGVAPKQFSHEGSFTLDNIVAYDKAEVESAYIGQINMSIVSSFCGPQGFIWGYDVAREDEYSLEGRISKEKMEELKNLRLYDGRNLRSAATRLFGTVTEKRFPFFPGSFVPCAGRFAFREGPCLLYSAMAIGIPDDREKNACLLMEDVGEIPSVLGKNAEETLLVNTAKSVQSVGRNQHIEYSTIFLDIVAKEVKEGEIGCAMVAMPYFLLAQSAYTETLDDDTLSDWEKTIGIV